jgi:hypothetical protein
MKTEHTIRLTPLTRPGDQCARLHTTYRTPGPSAPSPPTWPTVEHTVPEDHHRNESRPCPGRAVGAPWLTLQTATPWRLGGTWSVTPLTQIYKNERERQGRVVTWMEKNKTLVRGFKLLFSRSKACNWLRHGPKISFRTTFQGPIFNWLRVSLTNKSSKFASVMGECVI